MKRSRKLSIPNGLTKLWQQIAGQTVGSIDIVVQRFIQVFADHGIEVTQIPRVQPQIRLRDIESPTKLVEVLSPETLEQVAHLFGVRRQWLEGVDDQVYEYLGCYKAPNMFLDRLASVIERTGMDAPYFPVRVLTTARNLDINGTRPTALVPVIVEKLTELDDDEIFRYHVFQDGFDWSYEPGRIQLKALARIVFKKLGTPVPLFVISPKDMERVLEGRVIPRKYLQGCLLSDPSLEDYTMTKEESVQAKDVDELPAVMSNIEQYHMDDFSFDVSALTQSPRELPASTPASEDSNQSVEPSKSSKRVQAQAEIWEPARNAAKTLWAENDQLRIAEVIRRLKSMPVFKASRLSDSAIRKHIAGLAPPNIKGKSGRGPKKPI